MLHIQSDTPHAEGHRGSPSSASRTSSLRDVTKESTMHVQNVLSLSGVEETARSKSASIGNNTSTIGGSGDSPARIDVASESNYSRASSTQKNLKPSSMGENKAACRTDERKIGRAHV